MAVIISRRSSYCPNFATAPTDPPSFNYERGEHLSIAIWGVFLYKLSTSRVEKSGADSLCGVVWSCCFRAWLLADWDFTRSAIFTLSV